MANFYWIKLKKDFYKRHDIRLIESMPNGTDYIWFYMKLMMESVDHEGQLRFSEYIPYDNNMLAVITNTNIDTVKSAMELFSKLGMVEIMDDKTIFMTEVSKLIGGESNSTERVRKHRMKEIERNEVASLPYKEDEVEVQEQEVKPTKEKKQRYGANQQVVLSDAEVTKLKEDFPDVDFDGMIAFFDSYILEKAYKSKSHYLSIRRWVIEAIRQQNRPKSGKRVEQPMEFGYPEKTERTEEEKAKILEEAKKWKELFK